MLATDHIETARQFLQDADREYEGGDILQASEKLWGAATYVVIAEMQRRGMKASDYREMILAVRDFAEDFSDPTLNGLFSAAGALHANFYHGFMEEFRFQNERELTREFVQRMLEHTE